MSHKIRAVLILSFLLQGVPAQSSQLPGSERVAKFREHYREAIAAYREQDWAACIDKFEQAKKLRPNHPGLLYNLAAVCVLNGEHERGIATLARLAEMGLNFPAATDSDFIAVAEMEAFEAILTEFEMNGKPAGEVDEAFRLEEKDLVTECVVYSPQESAYYVSSVHKRKIIKIDAAGVVSDFVPEAAHGLWSVMGMKIDAEEGLLWATSSAVRQTRAVLAEEVGRAGLFVFDLKTGSLRHKALIADMSGEHILGDLVLHPDGDVYATGSRSNQIFRWSDGIDSLEIFLDSPEFSSLQGLAFAPDGRTLFVADYSLSIYKIDILSRTLTALTHPDEICVLGIDGIYWHNAGLVAVQNGVSPNRVIYLKLDSGRDRISAAEVIAANHSVIDDPTLGQIVNGDFIFVANSQWNRFDRDGKPAPLEEWTAPVFLKAKLP